ncbi:hypothetical protein KIW84_056344 [Lathyrus oleraceus]|uniref:Flavin-containing monooxygenase n=1 Tax=Pisum sativum TaxID=3888 RepID=A0A9D4WXX4_PEA|nr:hypothetical protein KIW84_056344 [Pisum sativum]
MEVYGAKFLVIASGENSEGFIPNLSGLEKFEGEVVHSKYYKSGSKYKSKDVLVVGCGNSGMEIAYDLHNCGANTSIVIRNPIHIFTRDMIRTGMCLVQYFPVYIVDIIITLQAKLKYGDLSTYGIYRPKDGPLYLKNITGKSAVIDFGTIEKIKEGAIKVVPSNIKKIEKKNVIFENNMEKEFDVIVFATGYKSVANGWLKDYHYALNENGFPKNSFPKHWKGDHGLYCAGLARKGLFGVKMDAEAIAKDIEKTLKDYRVVESAKYDGVRNKWIIEAKNTFKGTLEVYGAKFLVIASGENSEGFIPNLSGLEKFEGEVVHSKYYKSGSKYKSKDVLVVGCGNSGMEIAYDLHNCGANTSIVIRNPIHIFTRDMIRTGMCLVQYFPVYIVDIIITLQAKLKYGDLSTYGIYRPKDGPLYLKNITGKSAVIDFGTIEKIKEGAIKVVPSNIKKIEKKNVIFENNMEKEFDVIVFATGYKSVANGWLKDYHYALNENGFPKNSFPKHWKGDHGLYCAGLARKGLFGVKMDAEAIAKDIEKTLKSEN